MVGFPQARRTSMTRRYHNLTLRDAKRMLAAAEANTTRSDGAARGSSPLSCRRASSFQGPAGQRPKARAMIRVAWTLMLALLASQGVNAASNDKATSIVLVHGAFVDGSGWKAVYDLLSQDGYEVLVVQHTTSTLEGDAAAATSVIDS